jgi:flagellar biosynthesis/type III secretory pathway protein FliH
MTNLTLEEKERLAYISGYPQLAQLLGELADAERAHEFDKNRAYDEGYEWGHEKGYDAGYDDAMKE